MFRISPRSAMIALVAAAPLFAQPALPAMAREAPVYTGLFSSVAVSGYDPVAYFTDGKPVEGKKEFSTRWMNVEWRFASAQNRDLFVVNPEKYAPQYGGYCAWAVSQNKTASADPDVCNSSPGIDMSAEVSMRPRRPGRCWESRYDGSERQATWL
jgi:YHS domain-containing protein